ncbi:MULTISPECIES: hypothetical protein [unclassified Mesorhizobium]|nr:MULTISPECIES: hypothetical protein [unclassified Mesorhizobium]
MLLLTALQMVLAGRHHAALCDAGNVYGPFVLGAVIALRQRQLQ